MHLSYFSNRYLIISNIINTHVYICIQPLEPYAIMCNFVEMETLGYCLGKHNTDVHVFVVNNNGNNKQKYSLSYWFVNKS